ncbi:MAG: hypothetical protein ACJ8C4_17505 [Gemmataceae bacterium]
MNWQHFRAFVWLRYRIRANQLRKQGVIGVVFEAILNVVRILLALTMFVVMFFVGMFAFKDATPSVYMYAWDGLVGAFSMFWVIGIVTELQRSEALSLDKFLHLPVSLKSAFFINYISSLMAFSLIVFVPAALGLTIGLAVSHGLVMLAQLPVVFAFFLMVTALTYQFRGWLASIMTNPRRRRNVVMIATTLLILISQTPNIINMSVNHGYTPSDTEGLTEELTRLNAAVSRGEITQQQAQEQFQAVTKAHSERLAKSAQASMNQMERTAEVLNMAIPLGWLPFGAKSIADRTYWPAALGFLAMTFIGCASLWRGYQTTLRLYTGHFTSGRRKKAAAPAKPIATSKSRLLVERELPWISEQAAAVATSSLRGLLRAPEAKMMLLSPILMIAVFGMLMVTNSSKSGLPRSPFITYGAMGMILISMTQFFSNQFGFDRSGFRVFVLSAAPRREILLGKNLAIAPLALGLGFIVAALLQFLMPIPVGYLIAAVPGFITMYLLYCLLTNWASMIAPMPIAAGSLRPTGGKFIPVVVNLALLILIPMTMSPAFIPVAAGVVADSFGWGPGQLYCLILALAECALMIFLYRLVLGIQGENLQARELKILEVVASKAE